MVGNGIDDAELKSRILEQQVTVLRVYVEQSEGYLPEHANGYGTVVDEGTTLAAGRNFASQDALGWFVVQFVLFEERLHIIAFYVEDSLYCTFGRAGHDAACVGTLAHEQAECAKDDGFTGARLTRHDGETGLQLNIERFDENVIVDCQMPEHG